MCTSCTYAYCLYSIVGVNIHTKDDASEHASVREEKLALFPLHDVNYAIAWEKVWMWQIKKARWLKSHRIKVLDHLIMRLMKIDEYLNYVHPSGDVIFAKWYPPPDPIWVPKLLADENHALILDLNGLLVTIVETSFGQKRPTYADKMIKYNVKEGNWEVYCRKDSHKFLDWCIKYFNVYIWSTSMRHKMEVILQNVFAIQRPLLANVLS